MTDHRRFLLALLNGLVLFGGLFAVALHQEPQAQASDSPLLRTSAAPAAPTTTTVAPETTTTTLGAANVALPERPVTPPRNSYAPEPIQEIGLIEIPKIGLRHKVMHGITLRNIDLGPSHWPGTALPGQTGNAVFAGHRVTHSHPFRHIDKLVNGDEVHFTINGVRTTYVVTGHQIVKPNALWIVNPTPTPTATLFACHPPGSARERYVVRLALVDDSQPAPSSEPAPSEG
jgi:sortase A